jgi:hypothetical protein
VSPLASSKVLAPKNGAYRLWYGGESTPKSAAPGQRTVESDESMDRL